MTIKVTTVFLIGLMAINSAIAAEDPLEDNAGNLTAVYLPLSYHWSRGHSFNEVHHGIGLGLGIGNGLTVGAMRYRNSFGDMTTLASLDNHMGCWKEICFSVGGGYAWGYGENMMIPVAAWAGVRWKFLKFNTIPGVVTTVSILIPLNY